MKNLDLLREMVDKRLLCVRKEKADLPETDWEDGYNAALGYEIEFLTNLHKLMRDTDDRKGNDEDHDVGC